MIWATDFEEEIVTSDAGGGGKGGGGAGGVTQTEYRYFANFAVGLAEGEITGIGRVWADGSELDLSTVTFRLYAGTETQSPDSLIVAREGADALAYRGLAYIVFERMALNPFGNRLPQLSVEVFRSSDAFPGLIRGVVPDPRLRRVLRRDSTRHTHRLRWRGARPRMCTRHLAVQTPTSRSTNCRPSCRMHARSRWSRAGSARTCAAAAARSGPRSIAADKSTSPQGWSVAGLPRATASVVSQYQGQPAYGGTPSDQPLVDRIRDLAARGLSVTLNPFVLMDIAAGNTLPNPLERIGQPAGLPLARSHHL